MNQPYKNSYAKQLLREKGIELFQGQTRILDKNAPRYTVRKETPSFKVGDNFIEVKEDVQTIDYGTLKSMKYIITSINMRETGIPTWYQGQRKIYKIVPMDGRNTDIRQTPEGHFIEFYPTERALRLVGRSAGPNNAGDFIYMVNNEKRERRRVLQTNDYLDRSDRIMDKYFVQATGIAEAPRTIEIKELPFMITHSNEIVCLDPDLDEPRIGIFGQTGMGKSYAAHAILDQAYHHPNWRRKIAIINDSQAENGTWTLPNDKAEDIKILNKFGLNPKPLPIAFLHPTLEDKYEKIHPDEVGFDISLPYAQIVERFGEFFRLQGSEKYFQDLKEEILKCRSKVDVMELLAKNKHTLQQGTISKITATLGNIFQYRIADVSTNVPAYWKVRQANSERVYNPMTACIYTGIIPCIETQTLISYDFFPQYYKFYVQDIFDRQNNDLEFRAKQFRVWLYVDEALHVGATDKKGPAEQLLIRTVTEGRIRRIGVIIATQNFGKIPERIKTNIKTILCFNNGREAPKIATQYNLPTHYANVLKELKKFEMLAYTTDHFIVYNQNGERRKERGPFVGRCFPTMSLHQKPLSKPAEEEDEETPDDDDGEVLRKRRIRKLKEDTTLDEYQEEPTEEELLEE